MTDSAVRIATYKKFGVQLRKTEVFAKSVLLGELLQKLSDNGSLTQSQVDAQMNEIQKEKYLTGRDTFLWQALKVGSLSTISMKMHDCYSNGYIPTVHDISYVAHYIQNCGILVEWMDMMLEALQEVAELAVD